MLRRKGGDWVVRKNAEGEANKSCKSSSTARDQCNEGNLGNGEKRTIEWLLDKQIMQ